MEDRSAACFAFVQKLSASYAKNTPVTPNKFHAHYSNDNPDAQFSLAEITSAFDALILHNQIPASAIHSSYSDQRPAAPQPVLHTPVPALRFPPASATVHESTPAAARASISDSSSQPSELATHCALLQLENDNLRRQLEQAQQTISDLQIELGYYQERTRRVELDLSQTVAQRAQEDQRLNPHHNTIIASDSRSSLLGTRLTAPSTGPSAQDSPQQALEKAKQRVAVNSAAQQIPRMPYHLNFPLANQQHQDGDNRLSDLADRFLLFGEYLVSVRDVFCDPAYGLLTAAGYTPVEAAEIIVALVLKSWRETDEVRIWKLWQDSEFAARSFSTIPSFFDAVFKLLAGPVSEVTLTAMWSATIRASVANFCSLQTAVRKLFQVSDALNQISALPTPADSQLAIALVDALPSHLRELLIAKVRQHSSNCDLGLREATLPQYKTAIMTLAKLEQEAATFSGPSLPRRSGASGATPSNRAQPLPHGQIQRAPTTTLGQTPVRTPLNGGVAPTRRMESQHQTTIGRSPAAGESFAFNTAGSKENPPPSRHCVYCLSQHSRITRQGPHNGKAVGLNHNFYACRNMDDQARKQYLPLAQQHEQRGITADEALRTLFPTALSAPDLPRADSVLHTTRSAPGSSVPQLHALAQRPIVGMSGPRVLVTTAGHDPASTEWYHAATPYIPGSPYSSWTHPEVWGSSTMLTQSLPGRESVMGPDSHRFHPVSQPSAVDHGFQHGSAREPSSASSSVSAPAAGGSTMPAPPGNGLPLRQ